MRNYDDPAYKKFRTDVLKRDKFCCKMCKTSGKKRKMYLKIWLHEVKALKKELWTVNIIMALWLKK